MEDQAHLTVMDSEVRDAVGGGKKKGERRGGGREEEGGGGKGWRKG